MSNAAAKPVVARPSATAVILRDGRNGIETFMVVRHQEIDFASGALVFPGGKVDPQDSAEGWAEFAPFADAALDRAFVVAAARETFEEAGLVLARRRGGQGLVSPDQAHRMAHEHRARLMENRATFLDVIRGEDLVLATDLMVPFAHWITPEFAPKRFDTHFFLVAAPMDQAGSHDGSESVEGIWITPQQALLDTEAGKRTLVFATQMNLRKLARYRSVAEAVVATRSAPIVTVMPRVERTATGRKLYIPAEAGYGGTEFAAPAR
jgi:8-oxo-dGTP pyrophosphatase MutT (NUDIX family)